MAIPLSAIGAAGAAVSLKVPARQGYRTKIQGANVSMSATPVAAVAFQLIEGSGQTSRFNLDLTNAGPQNLYPPEDGWLFEVGQDVTASLAAPGGAVVGKLNLGYDYVQDTGSSL